MFWKKKDTREIKIWQALHSEPGETILAFLNDKVYSIAPSADPMKAQGMLYAIKLLKEIYDKSEKECGNT